MSGDVAFAVRRNGRVSTREFPKQAASHVKSVDFFEGKGDIWKEWNRIKAEPFAPIYYGLVVVDFDTKWIACRQSYTSLTKEYVYTGNKEELADLEGLWKAGRIEGYLDSEKGGVLVVPAKNQSFKEWIKPFLPSKKGDATLDSLVAKVSPPEGWTVVEFNKDEKGWQDFVAALIDKDFKISPRDVEVWEAFFKEELNFQPGIMGPATSRNAAKEIETKTAKVSATRPRRRI